MEDETPVGAVAEPSEFISGKLLTGVGTTGDAGTDTAVGEEPGDFGSETDKSLIAGGTAGENAKASVGLGTRGALLKSATVSVLVLLVSGRSNLAAAESVDASGRTVGGCEAFAVIAFFGGGVGDFENS